MYDLTPYLTVPVLISVLLLHVGLLVASWKFNPLVLIAGLFLVAAVLSFGTQLQSLTVAKYARVYFTILMVGIGLLRVRPSQFGPATKAILALAGLHLIAALWSSVPFHAFAIKSFFVWAVAAGVFLAYDIKNERQLLQCVRFLAVVASVGGVVILTVAMVKPSLAFHFGRLAFGGRSVANVLGANMAMGLLLCIFLGMYDRSKGWKIYAYSSAAMLTTIVAWTGSRGSLLTVIAGVVFLVVPACKRRLTTLVLVGFLALVPVVVLAQLQGGGSAQRILNTTDTRSHQWGKALDVMAQSPLIGHGWIASGAWLPEGTIRFNAHSSMFQFFMDVGMLGVVAFTVCCVVVSFFAYKMYRFVSTHAPRPLVVVLPLSLLVAVFVGAIPNGATLAGIQSTTLFLGFSIGLVDHLPRIIARQKQQQAVVLHQMRLRASRPVPEILRSANGPAVAQS